MVGVLSAALAAACALGHAGGDCPLQDATVLLQSSAEVQASAEVEAERLHVVHPELSRAQLATALLQSSPEALHQELEAAAAVDAQEHGPALASRIPDTMEMEYSSRIALEIEFKRPASARSVHELRLSKWLSHHDKLSHSAVGHGASVAVTPQAASIGRKETNMIFTSSFTCMFLAFLIFSLGDFNKLWSVLSSKAPLGAAEAAGCGEETCKGDPKHGLPTEGSCVQKNASLLTIGGLTVYRFYTGFLSATWLPYLLAMEGAELWKDNQALFMGIAKLIYGMSILLTPLFGLLGDRVARRSHALGRRLFIRLGVAVAAIGILACHWAAPRGQFWAFGLGVLVWRIGEGLNDVTIEAICPEMLPPEQFEISSAIRASMFLVGGLMGYVMIALFADLHYSWLYTGYLVMMFVCAVPPLLLIKEDSPRITSRSANLSRQSFWPSCIDAYVRPTRFLGGFPVACMCIFVFSCGSAPMFFLLLMLRDLVGIQNHISLQMHFSFISIDFFLSAAVAAVLNALLSPKVVKTPGRKSAFTEIRTKSFHITAASVIGFGIVCLLMPFVYIFPTLEARINAFYIMSAFFGAGFGSVYARFQDCCWQLLPPNVETANAMGFSTMCKLLGAGLGNFIAGLMLDFFQTPAVGVTDDVGMLIQYRKEGYIAVCGTSAMLAFAAGGLALLLPRRASEGREATDVQPVPGG